MAKKLNIDIDQATDFHIAVGFSTLEDVAIPLDDYDGTAQFRKSYQANTGFDLDVTINSNVVTLDLPKERSVDLEPGRYVYDVYLTHQDTGAVSRIIEGILTLNPRATHLE